MLNSYISYFQILKLYFYKEIIILYFIFQPNTFGFDDCLGCRECNCEVASVSGQCDQVTGDCTCQPGVEGKYCDRCIEGWWNYGIDGCQSMIYLLLITNAHFMFIFRKLHLFKNWIQSFVVLLAIDSIDWSTCMKLDSPSLKICTYVNAFTMQWNYKNCIQYLNTVEIINICFDIPHFELLLLCVAISFHDIRK